MTVNWSCKRGFTAITAATLLLYCAEGVCQVLAGPGAISAADQFFDSNGVRIRYVSLGNGAPIILIHGWSASAEMWASAIQTFRTTTVSLRSIAADMAKAASRLMKTNTEWKW
jgi:hypothetical protein